MRFWIFLAGFLVSIAFMIWMVALSIFVTIGDSIGNIFTLGSVQDGLSQDPVGGFIQQNTGVLVLICAIMALGFLYLTVSSRPKNESGDEGNS